MTHPLKLWLAASDMAVGDFAERCGISPTTLWRVMTGQGDQPVSLFEMIEMLTDGDVPTSLLLDARKQMSGEGAKAQPDAVAS